MSDDEIELLAQSELEIPVDKSLHLSSITDEAIDTIDTVTITQATSCKSIKNWKSPCLPLHAVHHLTQRRIYRDGKVEEPTKVMRIPVEIFISGEKFRGIIDSGSERSFLSDRFIIVSKFFRFRN